MHLLFNPPPHPTSPLRTAVPLCFICPCLAAPSLPLESGLVVTCLQVDRILPVINEPPRTPHPAPRVPMSLFLTLLSVFQLLREHAAIVLHKEPEELTAREEARMAYAIGDGMYTIARLSAHLGALVAGLPTE